MRGLLVSRVAASTVVNGRKLVLAGFAVASFLAVAGASAEIIDGEELIDPTRPFMAESLSANDSSVMDMIRNVIPASYDLSFVRMSGETSIAVINNQRVKVGDVIGGAVVMQIDRSGVTLNINNEERRIEIYGTSVKRPLVER